MVCRFKAGCKVIEVPVGTKFVSATHYLLALSQFPWPCLVGFSVNILGSG